VEFKVNNNFLSGQVEIYAYLRAGDIIETYAGVTVKKLRGSLGIHLGSLL
jgi:hypothetical protein